AGDADREQDDRGVDDVPAVTAPVPRHERAERGRPRAAREAAAGTRSARELERDRGEDEDRERVGDQAGPRGAGAEGDEDDAGRDGEERRSEEGVPERAQRGSAPGDERSDPHQQEQGKPEDAKEEVVVRARNRHGLAAYRLGEEREGDAPEDRQ